MRIQPNRSVVTPRTTTPPAVIAPKQATPRPSTSTTKTFDLPEVGTKTYTFPSRFSQVDLMTAQFALPADAVKRWLPPGLEPVSFAGQARGQVTMQHLGKPPDGMAPYDEGSFSVRVRRADGTEAWHTLTMPVNSLENRQRGRFIFGYPKEMAQVSFEQNRFCRRGAIRDERGAELFSMKVGGLNPFSWHHEVKNENAQMLDGVPVTLHASAAGQLKLGTADVSFGEAMRARFPGLPERPLVLFGGRLTGAELSLSLPEPTRQA